jgi:hypothetical protein
MRIRNEQAVFEEEEKGDDQYFSFGFSVSCIGNVVSLFI